MGVLSRGPLNISVKRGHTTSDGTIEGEWDWSWVVVGTVANNNNRR
jgi:hypothetical protein